ncbi:MAG: methyltransferase domain-containing protein [Syntrophorhabdaceae bacterium]
MSAPQELLALARDGVHEKVAAYLEKEPRGKLLDVPTGSGALAFKLKKMGFDVSCCDINAERFAAPGLSVDRGNLNDSLPYNDATFDYVCFLEAIEHTENPYNAVREISRVLKPNGLIVLTTPNYLSIERRLKFLVTGFFTKPVSKDKFRDRFGSEVYDMHLSPLGYTLIRFILEHAGFTITGMTYDRKKKKQAYLKPFVWLIRLYGHLWSRKKRRSYWLNETNGPVILDGGNTLIIFAKKDGTS